MNILDFLLLFIITLMIFIVILPLLITIIIYIIENFILNLNKLDKIERKIHKDL
jgi:hypothetical protein